MSMELAVSLALIALGSMWACYKIGFEAGQQDAVEKSQDYYRKRKDDD